MNEQLQELNKQLIEAGYAHANARPGKQNGTIDLHIPITGKLEKEIDQDLAANQLAYSSKRVFQAYPRDVLILTDVHSPAQRAAEEEARRKSEEAKRITDEKPAEKEPKKKDA